ncbi:unnamed protein product [Periconia digitata]|uniref:Uncharacterized protein n=1 Tax=Periconia digitata TaxID=1303443 RepID=A0A9W4UQD6_9PLEO|nr:unnamed protein product [Periconia digitata]
MRTIATHHLLFFFVPAWAFQASVSFPFIFTCYSLSLSIAMAMYQLFVSMLAVSNVFAGPILSPELEKGIAHFKARALPLDDPNNYDEICGHELDDSKPLVAADIWRQTGASVYLDIITQGDKHKDWVRTLDKNAWDKKQSDSWDCASMRGVCGHAADCKLFFDNERANNYWIFSAVAKAHSVFEYLDKQLSDNVLLNSLMLGDLIKDFGAENPKVNPHGAASGAFGAASGALGAVAANLGEGAAKSFAGPFGGAVGVISGAFGVGAATWSPEDAETGLETTLGQYYNHSKLALEQTMRNLFGEGNPEDLPQAGQTGESSVLKSPIGRFFNDGKFLIDSVDDVWGKYIDVGNSMLRKALGLRILSSQGYLIWINPLTGDKQCSDGYPASKWIDGACWRVIRVKEGRSPGSHTADYGWEGLPKNIWDTMTGKYEMDMHWIMKNSMECKRSRGNGEREVNTKDIPYTEIWAECLFNMDVVKAKEFDPIGGWFKNFGPL